MKHMSFYFIVPSLPPLDLGGQCHQGQVKQLMDTDQNQELLLWLLKDGHPGKDYGRKVH